MEAMILSEANISYQSISITALSVSQHVVVLSSSEVVAVLPSMFLTSTGACRASCADELKKKEKNRV